VIIATIAGSLGSEAAGSRRSFAAETGVAIVAVLAKTGAMNINPGNEQSIRFFMASPESAPSEYIFPLSNCEYHRWSRRR
jgi:hypothetical protein